MFEYRTSSARERRQSELFVFQCPPGKVHMGSVREEKQRYCSLKFLRSVFLHIGLIVTCIVYIVIGACIFQAIERPIEMKEREEKLKKFGELKKALIENVSSNATEVERWTEEYIRDMFDLFEDTHGQHVFETHFVDPSRDKDMWTLSSAVLFTSTTVIPVGYGFVTPTSSVSRLLVVVYGMVGIPLALITMADTGKFIAQFVTQCFKESLTIPTAIFLSLLTLYPIFGGVLFHLFFDMTLLDAVYFSLTSIFTIGFGDLTPDVNVIYLVLFIVFGVILVTITIDFVAAELIDRIHYMGRHVGKAKEIAGKMLSLAQSLNMNKGLTVGMTQLHALARFGLLGKLDQAAIKNGEPVHVAFEPSVEDMDFMDCGVSRDIRASKMSLYNIT